MKKQKKPLERPVTEAPLGSINASDAAKAVAKLPKIKNIRITLPTETKAPKSKPEASSSPLLDNKPSGGGTDSYKDKYEDLRYEHMETSIESKVNDRFYQQEKNIGNQISANKTEIQRWAIGTLLGVVAILIGVLTTYHFAVIQNIKKDVIDFVELYLMKKEQVDHEKIPPNEPQKVESKKLNEGKGSPPFPPK